MAQNDEPLLAGLKALSGVNEFSRACSICGKTSQQGWGTGLRKDWKTGIWYCTVARPVEIKMKSNRFDFFPRRAIGRR
jgi:hypothetical protein